MERWITEYLSDLASVERILYVQGILISQLRGQLRQLETGRELFRKKEIAAKKGVYETLLENLPIFACLFTGMIILVWITFKDLMREHGVYASFTLRYWVLIFIPTGIISCIISTIICIIVAWLISFARFRKRKKNNEYTWERLEFPLGSIENIPAENKAKIKEQLMEQIHQLTHQWTDMIVLKSRLCSLEIIKQKYQSIIPIHSFYEYFSTSQCITLKGKKGAYKLYKKECQMNLIKTGIEDVWDGLDTNEFNISQHTLYSSLKNMKCIVLEIFTENQKIIGDPQNIGENAFLVAFCSLVEREESRIMQNLSMYEQQYHKNPQ